ncbi:hypothetical protein [Nocardia farcinica]|uniref:hypothetical protein n=1 Tax=Nocardia farcinica TaxID=37329 RepID=UPI00245532A2|nr:hypothetical protein [Nocardia farcinica]
MARQTIVSTQQAERIIDQTQRHIRPIFGKCYGYPYAARNVDVLTALPDFRPVRRSGPHPTPPLGFDRIPAV